MPEDAEVLIHTYYMDDDEDEPSSLEHAKVGSAFASTADRRELQDQNFDITINRGDVPVAVISDLAPERTTVLATGRLNRREQTQAAIERGSIPELLRLAEGYECACKGAQDGEPLCFCKMNSQQVRDAVSLAALRRGKVVRLKPCPETAPKPTGTSEAQLALGDAQMQVEKLALAVPSGTPLPKNISRAIQLIREASSLVG